MSRCRYEGICEVLRRYHEGVTKVGGVTGVLQRCRERCCEAAAKGPRKQKVLETRHGGVVEVFVRCCEGIAKVLGRR